jgi:hypothetical protein
MRDSDWTSLLIYGFVIAAGLSSPAPCAQVQPDPCSVAVAQPSDISLQLSLKNGQNVFREGEIIGLVAQYSSPTDKKYYLNTRNYDRNGRLDGMEVFCLEPTMGDDPLSDYFNGVMISMGGGLSAEETASDKPYTVNLELNEWKSLPPGSYRLRILSHRVVAPTKGNSYEPNALQIPLRSNDVEFQVVKADSGWQGEQLAAAESALDSSGATDEDAKHAVRVLRFLGSEAATRELARRFWSGNEQPFGWDLKFGLFGSRYRTAAIERMKDALKNPQHPVTQEFIQTLTTLEMQSDPKYRLPKYDENDQEAWVKARDPTLRHSTSA